MPSRLRLYDCRNSRLPGLLGLCQADIPSIANFVNSAQRRLILAREAGEEGFWGTWAEIAFQVSRTTPYITLPNDIARLESIVVCDRPVPLQNQFYEYLEFGNGRFPKHFHCGRGILQGYARNNAVTFVDLSATAYIRAYPTNAQDVGKSVFLQGYDQNGNIIYSQNLDNVPITGTFMALTQPFAQTPMTFSPPITGIQKDATVGPVQFYEVDPTTGAQTLILTMQPGEMTASYRRYYFNSLPCTCCPPTTTTVPQPVQVRAIAKLDLVPVVADTDYCLIQNLEAIIEECQSVRYSEMDNANAKTMAAERHIQAIRLLNGELNHFIGQRDVAMHIAPFGSARLEHQRIGRLI